jgi:hypothetical protein
MPSSPVSPLEQNTLYPACYVVLTSPFAVHQESIPLHEKILRHFDLSSQYGPCIGIPRLTRWRRANGLGLQPPIEVLAVLLREEEGGDAKEGMQYGRKGRSQGCGKIAYIDELGGGRVVLVE